MPDGKSDLMLVFDFETDPSVFGPERLRHVGRMGMLIGVPGLLIGFALSFMLFGAFHVVSKLTILPVGIGGLLLATGLYRFGLGVAPALVRSRALRLGFLFLILCGLFAATFLAYFAVLGFDGD